MKKIYTLYLILVFFVAGFSQDYIDSLVNREKQIDKTRQHLIYEYRLPDWGYRQFYLNFSNSLGGQKRENQDVRRYNSNTNIHFAPYYILYSESEQKITSIEVILGTFFYHSVSENKNNSITSESILNQLRTDLNIDGSMSYFLTNDWFLSARTDNRLYFSESHDNDSYRTNGSSSSDRSVFITRDYDLSGRIGLGFGRLRNVTPVFRALRFNERLKDLKKQTGSPEELAELAAFFAQRSAYSETYDRATKYFYNNLPDKTIKILQNAQPWEIIYLDETWNEIIGNRLEGFDMDGGVSFDYEKNDNSDVYTTELFLLGLYLQQRYYHNICPSYQLGTNFYSSFSKSVNNNTPYNYLGKGKLQVENLWNLTDKVLTELDLGMESVFTSKEKWQRRDRYFSEITFRYFLENNISANLTASYNIYKNWPASVFFDYEDIQYNANYEDDKSWILQFSLTYFLERGLL